MPLLDLGLPMQFNRISVLVQVYSGGIMPWLQEEKRKLEPGVDDDRLFGPTYVDKVMGRHRDRPP